MNNSSHNGTGIICSGCQQVKESVSIRKVKENGVLGYYTVEKYYCDECLGRHNRNLLETRGS